MDLKVSYGIPNKTGMEPTGHRESFEWQESVDIVPGTKPEREFPKGKQIITASISSNVHSKECVDRLINVLKLIKHQLQQIENPNKSNPNKN